LATMRIKIAKEFKWNFPRCGFSLRMRTSHCECGFFTRKMHSQ
jgi:hypothetical protein